MPATDLLRSRICKQEVAGSIPAGSIRRTLTSSMVSPRSRRCLLFVAISDDFSSFPWACSASSVA